MRDTKNLAEQVALRLTADRAAQLNEFCARTARRRTEVLRRMVELFFADGSEIVEQRLVSGLAPDGCGKRRGSPAQQSDAAKEMLNPPQPKARQTRRKGSR